MNQERRSFLRNTLFSTGFIMLQKPIRSLAAVTENSIRLPGDNRELMIWHTNDLHGQASELLPAADRHLLLDAGDFTDNEAGADAHIEMVRAMNRAGYHAATIGNRELANGQAALAALIPHMQFALVNCNYRFSDKSLSSQVLRYKIVYMGNLKVGITGVGPQLPAGSGVTCLPPVAAANAVAISLKKDHGCDVVICLSHLGYEQPGSIEDNRTVAEASTHIDFVIGGHQKKILTSTVVLRNALGNEVYLSQAGWNGMMAGNMKMQFNEEKQGCGIQPGSVVA
jgi:5'-nucleotidase